MLSWLKWKTVFSQLSPNSWQLANRWLTISQLLANGLGMDETARYFTGSSNKWRSECKTLLSEDLGAKKFWSKLPEYLHVVFNVIEKHGPVFLPLVFAFFSRYNVMQKALFSLVLSQVFICWKSGSDCKDAFFSLNKHWIMTSHQHVTTNSKTAKNMLISQGHYYT